MLSSWRMYEMHPALSFKTGCDMYQQSGICMDFGQISIGKERWSEFRLDETIIVAVEYQYI
jgi:hypothetical protein